MSEKNDCCSRDNRNKGNKLMLEGDRNGALIAYNKAICNAESKENLALAYGHRSIVYLSRKKYDECLQNIQWARENNYPEDKIQKLNEREEKCKQLKAAQVKDPEEDPWNFLQLSHPPNSEIPFIVDCLEMKVTEKYGRGIYATRDVSTGDILSIEESIVQCSDLDPPYGSNNDVYRFCRFCAKPRFYNLIPCSIRSDVMFCSSECKEKMYKYSLPNPSKLFDFRVMKTLADLEEKFGGREKLLEFLESVSDITALNYSIFDFDWSNPENPEYGMNQVKCFISLQPFDNCMSLLGKAVAEERNESEKMAQFIQHAHSILNFYYREGNHVVLRANFADLINHSCNSNVQRIQVENKVLVYATKPIKAGEQIFVSYNENRKENNRIYHYLEEPSKIHRFANLKVSYKFDCDCVACEEDLKPEKCHMLDQKTFTDLALKSKEACDILIKYALLKPAIDQWNLNNEFITKHHEDLLSLDVHLVKKLNLLIISEIANEAALNI